MTCPQQCFSALPLYCAVLLNGRRGVLQWAGTPYSAAPGTVLYQVLCWYCTMPGVMLVLYYARCCAGKVLCQVFRWYCTMPGSTALLSTAQFSTVLICAVRHCAMLLNVKGKRLFFRFFCTSSYLIDHETWFLLMQKMYIPHCLCVITCVFVEPD